MRLFLDTNLFVAILTDESGAETDARRVLDSDHQLFTSVLNLMELRTVLTKQKLFELAEVERAQQRIVDRTTVTVPDAGDVLAANERQEETLVYPMDALILSSAEAMDATLVTLDAELQEHGAIPPGEVV